MRQWFKVIWNSGKRTNIAPQRCTKALRLEERTPAPKQGLKNVDGKTQAKVWIFRRHPIPKKKIKDYKINNHDNELPAADNYITYRKEI